MDGTLASLKMPDLWFDAIARLVPGVLFATAIAWQTRILPADNQFLLSLAIAVIGYGIGFVASAYASLLAYLIEHRWFNERDIDIVRVELSRDTRQAMILSKMHGETVAFLSISLLSITFAFTSWVVSTPYALRLDSWQATAYSVCVALISAGSTLSCAWRREQRAYKYRKDVASLKPQAVPK